MVIQNAHLNFILRCKNGFVRINKTSAYRKNMTQGELASLLGVSFQAVSRWETGYTYPDMEIIPSIAHYFHVSIDELFGYSEDREEQIP